LQIVQLYIHDNVASVVAYVKVLRGFERVSLKAGETKTITFTLIPRHLGLIDKNKEFTVGGDDCN
jgi:beta-glucosidase